MTDPWSTRVKCQHCDKEANVDRPGLVRPGWVILVMQSTPLASKPPEVQQLPFCGLSCLYAWAKERLPSKRGKDE